MSDDALKVFAAPDSCAVLVDGEMAVLTGERCYLYVFDTPDACEVPARHDDVVAVLRISCSWSLRGTPWRIAQAFIDRGIPKRVFGS